MRVRWSVYIVVATMLIYGCGSDSEPEGAATGDTSQQAANTASSKNAAVTMVKAGTGVANAAEYNPNAGPNRFAGTLARWKCSGANCSENLMPADWYADTVEDAALIVSTESTYSGTGKMCSYTGGYKFEVMKQTSVSTLYNARTAEVLSTRTFVSDKACPSTASGSSIESGQVKASVDLTEVSQWLDDYIDP